ncbi:MAG: MAPEG family protein [Saccharospirillaceae bacterium]|nr:MAPEG family protein [Pseudomonadales bacterium]NRB77436.1 MAPEG family protein [Saccharospirillaceae bacterium]
MEFVALVTILAVLEYAVFALLVGLARGRTGVLAPETSGHPEFERYFRVQQNTLERLVIFIPSLWVFSYYVNPLIGAAIGVVFIIARAGYCVGYVKAPEKRKIGYNVGELANNILMLGAIVGSIYSYFY